MRAFWTGNITVGLLQVPVGLVPAIRDNGVELRRLHVECMTPVGRRAWCNHHDRALADDEIVLGYEVAPGQHVTIQADEVAQLAPDDTRTVDVACAVPAELVDDTLVERRCLLSPSEAPVGRRPYEVLRQALDQAGVVLLARLAVRGHEWVARIRPEGRLLMLDKLHPVEDLADRAPLEKQLAGVTVTEQETQLATELVRELVPMRPRIGGVLKLEQRQRLRRLVDAKIAGEPVKIAASAGGQRAAAATLPTDDLAATLRASLPRRRGQAKHKPRARPAAVKQ